LPAQAPTATARAADAELGAGRLNLPPGPRTPALAQTLAWWSIPYLERCRERYGKAFTLRLLAQEPWVMISDPAEIKQVFTAPADVIHPGEGAALVEPIVGPNSILLLDEDAHLAKRKLVLPAFHGQRMEAMRGVMAEVAEQEISQWPLGRPVPLHPHVLRLTLEVILRAVFGLERGSDRLRRLRSLLAEWGDFGASPLSLLPPLQRENAKHGPVARFMQIRRETDEQIYALISERRAAGGVGDDALAILLGARHDDGSPMTDAEIRDDLLALLVAGYETTATELSWCIERLTHTPRACARLVEEIDAGREEDYLKATIRETLRRRPVLINAQPRKVVAPIRVGDYDYGPGCHLIVNAYLVHHDPEIYPDPYAFKPERFLGVDPGTYTWIPFGGGRRRCLGSSFAMLEMSIVLRTLLSQLELDAVGSGYELNLRRMISVIPGRGATAELRPRADVSPGAGPAANDVVEIEEAPALEGATPQSEETPVPEEVPVLEKTPVPEETSQPEEAVLAAAADLPPSDARDEAHEDEALAAGGLPPGPRSPGLWQMRHWFRDPISLMEDNARRYGPIFSVRLGALKRCAFVADPAAAWQVLSGDPSVFRMGPTNKIFRPVLGENSLFLLDGEQHRHHRRLMAPAFHPGHVRGYASLIEEITARELAGWPVGQPFELQEPMRRITTESIVRIVVGVCSTPERDAEIRSLVREMLAIAENPLALMPQFQRELGGRSPFGKVMNVTRRIDEILYDEIGERRHHGGVERGSDVMSALAAPQPHEDGFMTDREIRDEVLTMLIAGHETTANALAWSFERILRHPVVHDRLLAELAAGEGDEYLQAVVKETLRQRPPLPITARRLYEPREIGGYEFPAGWTLMPCIYLIHRDPEVFPEPDAFRPERFLGDERPSSRVWIPFGAGSRHCVGIHLALLEIRTVLRAVLTRASLTVDDEPEPIVRNNMTLAPGRGATATLVGRRGRPVRDQVAVS
jgi:cytochrome P450